MKKSNFNTISYLPSKSRIVLLLFLFVVSLVNAQNLSKRSDLASDPLINPGPKSEALGKHAMVSTQVPEATEIAVNVLKNGGNAFDAYITTVLAQMVMEPHMVSHWGIVSGLIYDAKEDEYICFDGLAQRPLATRGDTGDPSKVTIAGAVKALGEIWKRYGTMEWEDYFGPAIKAAEEGVLVTPFMYSVLYAAWENHTAMWPEGVRDVINNKEARDFYMPEGFLVPPGKRWKMPATAEHFRRLSKEGADYMYTGDWAKKFVKESNKLGGRVCMEDMEEYEIIWRKPIRYNYRGHEIVTEALPASGGFMIACNLNILENFDLKKMGHYTESADALEIMIAASDRVFTETSKLGDPGNYYFPEELMLSDEYGKMAAEFIKQSRVRPGVNLDPGNIVKPVEEVAQSSNPYDSDHNTIVDKDGNWISSLFSGHGGTPGYFFDGVEANGSDIPGDIMGPGRRSLTPLAGTMIIKDGKPWLTLGTPGYPPQPITEVLVNILEYGMEPYEAIDATRFWQPDGNGKTVRIESRISDNLKRDMAARGYTLLEQTDYNWHYGSVQLIWRDKKGVLHGLTDPRRLGYASGY